MLLAFDEFELDLDRYELRRSGRRLELQRLPMDLLTLLVEQRGALVTRHEIERRLWRSEGAVDVERSINTAVRKIRRALEDDSDMPQFVETVIGKGYRFIAPVAEVTPRAVVPAPAAAVLQAPNASSRASSALSRRYGMTALSVILPLAALGMISTWTNPNLTARITPFTALPGSESTPAFSPDGRQVAFAWNGDAGQGQHLFLKTVGTDRLIHLTDAAQPDSYPSWSPDGRWIAFLRQDRDGAPSVYVVSSQGGPARKIRELSRSTAFRPAWSIDGSHLAVADAGRSDAPRAIFLVPVNGGEARRLTTPFSTGGGDSHPVISPDGRTLAFLRNQGGVNVSLLYRLSVDRSGFATGAAERIETDRVELSDIEWTAGGDSLICSAVGGMVRIRAKGGRAEPLPFPDARQASVSRTGNRIVYVQEREDSDIFRIPGPGYTGAPAKWLTSTRLEGAGKYSPDGRRIVFISDRTGSNEVWVADSEGQHATQVTSFARASLGSPRWSPDSRWIAFDSTAEGRSNIVITAADGGPVRQLTAEGANVRPSWSLDGQWIYFGSNRSGAWEIWKCPSNGGTAVRVTANGGREAFEDPEGKYLYYTKPQSPGIWRMPVAGGAEEAASDRGSQGRWAVGARGLYYLRARDELELQEFGTGRRIPMPIPGVALAADQGVFGGLIGVGPHDRWILVTGVSHSEGDLMLVENFR